MYFNPLHGFYPTKCPTRRIIELSLGGSGPYLGAAAYYTGPMQTK